MRLLQYIFFEITNTPKIHKKKYGKILAYFFKDTQDGNKESNR